MDKVCWGWKARSRQQPPVWPGVLEATLGPHWDPRAGPLAGNQGADPPEAVTVTKNSGKIVFKSVSMRFWPLPHPPIWKFISQLIYTDLKNDQNWSPRGWIQPMGWKFGGLLTLIIPMPPKWSASACSLISLGRFWMKIVSCCVSIVNSPRSPPPLPEVTCQQCVSLCGIHNS